MESRIHNVRVILNGLVDNNGGSPSHSGKGRFWNLSRDEFVNGPIYGKVPITPGESDNSFLIKILQGTAERFPRMPTGGPYITDDDLQFIKDWIDDGAPDADREFKTEFTKNPLMH